ncbi:MAG TPA: FHA domain-containing protein [Candidatus Paceibacterota bacterium]|nr:FHA domain-containing protein [Candidatus Paceibacterota bacterium]
MARLIVKTAGLERQLIELRLGSNVIGRSPDSDFPLTHPTISTIHCELVLNESGVVIRDLESTNGTFLEGQRIREATLAPGNTLRLGDVELLVETTDANVFIPKFANTDLPAPPTISKDGAMICPRHPHAPVAYQCTACKEVMCNTCVHRLRRKGSKNVLLLCPVCSHAVKLIGEAERPKKRSFFSRVGETVKLKLTRTLHVDK